MGAVFAFFSGFYYWYWKIFGGYIDEVDSRGQFWLLFFGVNWTFMPMHWLGLSGMPRRIPDYPDAYDHFNNQASQGSTMSLVSAVLFFCLVATQMNSECLEEWYCDIDCHYEIIKIIREHFYIGEEDILYGG
jgi:cytochrome c oxidase subunit 1